AVFALAALGLRSYSLPLAHTHALTAAALLTLGLPFLLENDVLYFALAVEAAALLFVSRRLLTESVSAAADRVFLGVGWWFLQRIVAGNHAPVAVFNGKALTDLAVIALALVASFTAQP